MLNIILRRILGDWRRCLASFLAVFIAVTSFVVLTSTATTQYLQTISTAADNYRGAYDIVVRPKGSVRPLEQSEGLVRSAYLTANYGGISFANLEAIRQIHGIEVAAPVAVVGYGTANAAIQLNVKDLLPAGTDKAIFRFHNTISSRNGSFTAAGDIGYIYVSRTLQSAEDSIDGVRVAVCPAFGGSSTGKAPTLKQYLISYAGWCTNNEGTIGDAESGVIHIDNAGNIPYLIAAIDPAAEAQLAGLDKAVTTGRYLQQQEPIIEERKSGEVTISGPTTPALINGNPAELDLTLTSAIEQLPQDAIAGYVATVAGTSDPSRIGSSLHKALGDVPGVTVRTQTNTGADLQQLTLTSLQPDSLYSAAPTRQINTLRLTRPSDITVDQTTKKRSVNPVQLNPNQEWYPAPLTALSDGVRSVTIDNSFPASLVSVGVYDPALTATNGSPLSALPMETYRAQQIIPADPATSAITGPALRFNGNIRDYYQNPPSALIPLDTLKTIRGFDTDPISAIRIKVSGITGMDDLSKERIRSVAEQIKTTTGLEVDITVGTSLARVSLTLPEQSGVPSLNVVELWSKKGAVVALVQATDYKSVMLSILILLSSVLTVSITTEASVTARRRELALLSTIGWRPRTLLRAVAIELMLIGAAAGIAGTLVSYPITKIAQLTSNPLHTFVAIPAAIIVTLLAGLSAAIRGAKTHPAAILTHGPQVRRTLRIPGRGATWLGIIGLLRRPSRVLLGASAVALGVASITVLTEINRAFRGSITGTLLGEAVTINVRTPDLVAAGCLGLLGLVSVAMVIFMGLTEDAAMYASLQAIGWKDWRIGWIVTLQSLIISAIGCLLGGALSLAGTHWLISTIPPALWRTWLQISAGALALTLLVAIVPALCIMGMNTARTLTVE